MLFLNLKFMRFLRMDSFYGFIDRAVFSLSTMFRFFTAQLDAKELEDSPSFILQGPGEEPGDAAE